MFNNHSLYRILVTSCDMMKMKDIAPRAGIERTSLAFCASLFMTITPPRLPNVATLSVYAALCLRGQCRLLQNYIMPNSLGTTSKYILPFSRVEATAV